MNKESTSKIKMYRTTRKLVKDNSAEFENIPMFMDSFGRFDDKLAEIDKLELLAMSDPTPAAERATRQKRITAEAAVAVAQPTALYARSVGDDDLYALMNVRFSDIHKQTKEAMPVVCTNIHTAASAVLTEAARFSLTDEKLKALDENNKRYVSYSSDPRLAHGKVNSANKQILALFPSTDEMLEKELDVMMRIQKEAKPDLYNQWVTARRIVHDPSTPTSFLLVVRDEEGRATEGAKVVFTKRIVRETLTDEDGQVFLGRITPGESTLEIFKDGFVPFKTAKLWMERFAENKLEVVLKKA